MLWTARSLHPHLRCSQWRPLSHVAIWLNARTAVNAIGRQRTFSASKQNNTKQYSQLSDEVKEALESGKPVVALETAIYTHGRLVLTH